MEDCCSCHISAPCKFCEDQPDPDEVVLDDTCSKCGAAYDAIDYEYQICHHCKHQNQT